MVSSRFFQATLHSIVTRSTAGFRFAILFAIFFLSSDAWADSATQNAQYRDQLVPLLRTYCFDCHGSDHAEGDVKLDKYESVEAVLGDRKEWMRALKQVQLGSMPPLDGPQLDPQTRARMIQLIDDLANAVDCVRNPNPGKVTLRRLTRNEYRNTVRDLAGVDYEPATGFPGDDVGYGFDNIGDVLSLPPLLMEKYLDAAEQIAGQAIVTAPPGQIFEVNRSGASLAGADKLAVRGSSLGIYSRGTATLEVDLPFAGDFVLTMTASGDQGGNEPVKVEVISGKFKQIVDVPNKTETEHKVPLKLAAGKREISFTFINDFYDAASKKDRNLYIHHLNLTGEERRPRFVLPLKLPESHEKLIFVRPTGDASEEQASATVLQRLASRAFRRPATSDEVKRLTALASQVRKDGGTYDESIQVALQAILVSPHFLFKVEQPATPDATGKFPTLTQYELATRISYFLWSSMPDDELLLLAHQGKLRDPKILRGKVGRMMQDPRINRFVDNFASQWLELRSLADSMPDKRQFREFDDEIRELMRRETLTFFAAVVRGNLPVTQLLEADFTYLNDKLAKYYDIRNVEGPAFRKVSLEGTGRGGLLTHGSVLTVTSNPSRTSPVKRGKWILDNLLNMPPPPAPPDIPELEKAKLVGTLRQRMEQHRTNPACAACHNMMDPLGFALENYDAVGRYRKRDGGSDIDASGRIPDGTAFVGADGLRRVLAIERREQFVKALIEKMMTYAIGRGVEYYDKCAVDKILSDSRAYDYRFAYILAGIIESDPFQKLGERE
ncbi:MAG TPA: filamin [Planctomycetaceae bacterium]|nr:filamin [Planctomycetaceae bacterium]